MIDRKTSCLVHIRGITQSTNADAMRLAEAGEPLPFWVVADVQTGGRGRDGRVWQSAPGNLYASFAATIATPAACRGQLSLVAGIAAFDAIAAANPAGSIHGLRLKWPNDLLIQRAKLGGVLIEVAHAVGRGSPIAVIGIGLNLASSPPELGDDAVSLASAGVTVERDVIVALLDSQLQHWRLIWNDGLGFDAVRRAWLDRSGPRGEPILVKMGAQHKRGFFAGLAPGGGLLIETGDGIEIIHFGDVALAPHGTGTEPI